jgi:hypothetical protein
MGPIQKLESEVLDRAFYFHSINPLNFLKKYQTLFSAYTSRMCSKKDTYPKGALK